MLRVETHRSQFKKIFVVSEIKFYVNVFLPLEDLFVFNKGVIVLSGYVMQSLLEVGSSDTVLLLQTSENKT